MKVSLYPGLALPEGHPLAGREAWRCSDCLGFFYPAEPPTECPYCAENDS